MKSVYLIITLLLAMSWSACNIINPPEKIPTYVHIDSFAFHIAAGQGTASHAITSVMVYYNNNPIGTFDLPVTFPVITSGDKGVITVAPCVSVNGLYSFQTAYVYYKYDTMVLRTNPGKDTTFLPTTSYLEPLTHFPWTDDFDAGNDFFGVTDSSKYIKPDAVPSEVFEGSRSGRMDIGRNDTGFVCAATNYFTMDVNGETYLELNYKCSTPFTIGVDAFLTPKVEYPVFLVGANPNPNGWKKMYVSLQTVAQQYPNGSYRILIRMLPGSGYVLLDNLKVVGAQ